MRKTILWLVTATALQAGLAATTSKAAHSWSASWSGGQPGTIVVKTSERRLYHMLSNGQVMVFPVAVGKPGKSWSGVVMVDGKYLSPAWMPPADIRRAKPNTPRYIPGGAPNNPMGAAALTLSGGGEYAIHGTNAPDLIGQPVSFGCIRMHNEDILQLYKHVRVGTYVWVVP